MILFSAGVLTFIACWSQISSGDVYHVYSINECKHDVTYPCTISDYASNTNLLESGDTELIISSGTHMLNEVFNISNTDNFSMHSSAVGETPLIKCVQGVHFNFLGVRNLNISSLNFTNCSGSISRVNGITSNQSNMSSGLYFHNVVNLTLKSIRVSGTKGYGAFLSNIYGQVMIEDSYFQYSYDSEDFQGGNMRISYYECTNNHASNMTTSFIIQDGVIAHGRSRFNNLSSGVLILFKCPEISLSLIVKGVQLINNTGCNCTDDSPLYSPDPASKPYGGNMAIMFISSELKNYNSNKYVSIENTRFIGGLGLRGGGLFVQYSKNSTNFTDGITITNCWLESNTAFVDGGGIYFQQEQIISSKKWSLKVENTTFYKNFVRTEYDAGIGLTLTYYFGLNEERALENYLAHIKNCTFSLNKNLPIYYQADNKTRVSVRSSGSSALYVSQQPQKLIIMNSSFTDNEVTGVAIFRSVIKIIGYVNISNNTGYEGGGIVLCEASYIIMRSAAVLNISNNHAELSGGGIFAESQCVQKRPLCFYQVENFDNETMIILDRNTAEFAGSQLYGGTVEDCHIPGIDHDIFFDLFHFNYSQDDTSYIASDPLEVCFCNELQKPDCSITNKKLNGIYSGESPYVSLAVVGQYNGTVPGVVELSTFQNGDIKSNNITKTVVRDVDTKCSTYNFTLFSENKEETILLRVKNARADYRLNLKKKLITVPIKEVPLGFQRNYVHYNCISIPDIASHSFSCIIEPSSQAIIARNSTAWLGRNIINGKLEFVVHPACPLDYCKVEMPLKLKTNSSIFDSDQQCQDSRMGTLCGKCRHNRSLSLGTNNCIHCKHVSFKTTLGISVGYAILGIVLVVILLVFNITVTQGTFSGFLFYANILYVFRDALIPSRQFEGTLNSISKHLYHVVIAPSNLVTCINSCFYNGLDMTGHIWINFLEASYFLIITGAIIVICKYSTWISKRLGSNTVPVLATIFILSNTVINISVIYSLTPATLNYERILKRQYVLLYDGTVTYWGKKHIPLFIVGCVFGLFSTCFTLLLLFIRPLQRYSHWRLLEWVNRLKPLLDAYSCPHIIKSHCRFWNGFLLLVRSILYFIFMFREAYYSNGEILRAVTVACLVILFLSWVLGGVYTKSYLNILSASYTLNMGILSVVIRSESSNTTKDAVVAASLIIASITFLCTILYHVYMSLKGNFVFCRKFAQTIFPSKIRREYQQMIGYLGSSGSENSALKKSKQYSQHYYYSEYREPQLLDDGTIN